MSTYCTLADLYSRFGQGEIDALCDRDGDGVPDPGVSDAAIAAASDLIDSYLASRYALPLASVPAVLNRLAGDLTRYELYSDAAPDIVRDRQNAAVKLLRELAAGSATFGLPEAQEPAPLIGPDYSAPAPVFDNGGLDDYLCGDR